MEMHNMPDRQTEARTILEARENGQQCYFCISTTNWSQVLIIIEGNREEFPGYNETVSQTPNNQWLIAGRPPINPTPNAAANPAEGNIYPFFVYKWNVIKWQGPLPLEIVVNEQGQQVQQVVRATDDQTVLVHRANYTMEIKAKVIVNHSLPHDWSDMSRSFTIERQKKEKKIPSKDRQRKEKTVGRKDRR